MSTINVRDNSAIKTISIEALSRFIFENLDPHIDCESCKKRPDYEHTDCLYGCPLMSEKQVLNIIRRWIEEESNKNEK